jgi:hypothetical protein
MRRLDSVFRPPSPPTLGGKSQSPPRLGDLGGCTEVYSIENRYEIFELCKDAKFRVSTLNFGSRLNFELF